MSDENGGGYVAPQHALSDLDAWHAAVGLGPMWLASERRAEIVAHVTVPGEIVEHARAIPPTVDRDQRDAGGDGGAA